MDARRTQDPQDADGSAASPPAVAADTRTRRTQRPSTLSQRLVLLFAAFSLGPLVISNMGGYLQSRRYLTAQALRDIGNVAALEAAQTSDFELDKRDFASSIFAGNVFLAGLVKSLTLERDPIGREDLQGQLRAYLRANANEEEDVRELNVMSPSGELLASSRLDRVAGADLSNDACFRVGAKATRVVGFEYPGEEPTLVVGSPILGVGDDLLGVLCARFRFDIHHELLAASKDRTFQATLLLVDAQGRIIDGSYGDLKSAPVLERVQRPMGKVIGGSPAWQGLYRLGSGEEIIGAYAPLHELGWGILAEEPVSRAISELNRLKWQGVSFGLLLTVVLVLAALFTARKLASPLKRLSEAARRAAGGALGERVSVDGPREVADLAQTFNRMSVALRDSQQLLEQRIEHRTLELSRSQEFSELLLNSIDQRVVVLDPNLRIIKANRIAVQAYGSDLIGRSCCDVFEGREPPSESCPVAATFKTGEPSSAERSDRIGKGREILHIDTFPVFSAGHAIEAVIQIGRVVTPEKRLQAEIVHHEKMAAFGLLAAGIAHEIGNPLASIEAQLRMTREIPEPARVSQTLSVVEREVQRVSRLVRELVDFARRRRNDIVLVSLNDVVEDVSRLIGHDPRARKIRIDRRLAPGLPGVRAREDHLVQVFFNLAINAVDAMPDGGTLTFETAVVDGVMTARICDTGHGFPEEAYDRLFEPFFTTKGPRSGTGLGLFVSKGIVEELGGSLGIERTGMGGTTFFVRLPAQPSQGGRA
jgi:signal transduction histidine kinase